MLETVKRVCRSMNGVR